MKSKQLLSLFLALLMTASAVSCGTGESSSDTTADTENAISDDTTPFDTSNMTIMEQRALISDDLPVKDYDGRQFMMYVHKDVPGEFVLEAETGEIVDDAVYARMIKLEERFNVDIVADCSGVSHTDHTKLVSPLILSGDDTYDLVSLHSMKGSELSLEGAFVNLYDLEYIHFDKPWWPKYVVDELTLMGQMYVFSSPITTNIVSGSNIYYFNRDLITSYKLENPYDVVKAGEWTISRMEEMIKDTYADLNGNNTADMNDRYGFATYMGNTYYSTAAAGVQILKKTADTLELVVNNERTLTFVEKTYSLFTSPNSHITEKWTSEESNQLFLNGNAIFVTGSPSDAASTFRDSSIDFGMVPMPKLDETQEEYITMGGRVLYAVPSTVKDPEFAGLMVEALTAEGYKSVLPTYYEYALKQKFVRDEEYYEQTLEILDLIEQTLTLTFWYMYGGSEPKLYVDMANKLLLEDYTDFASYYARTEGIAKEQIKKILTFFESNR